MNCFYCKLVTVNFQNNFSFLEPNCYNYIFPGTLLLYNFFNFELNRCAVRACYAVLNGVFNSRKIALPAVLAISFLFLFKFT